MADPAIIFTDDGWIFQLEPPLTVDDLQRYCVDPYRGTGGALWWSIGDHEVYHCEMQAGQIVGQDAEGLDAAAQSFVHGATPGSYERIAANVQGLIKAGGPLRLLTAQCRAAGLPFSPRVRMNSHYLLDPAHPAYGRVRRQHPEWLLGKPGEDLPPGSVEWAVRTGLDYRLPQVRAYQLAIICECFERFEVDGVELDFMRHPAFFRLNQGYAHRHLMTDLVAQVRQRIEALGRPVQLAVRVPPTLADSLRLGLDVEAWIEAGLVDSIVVGGGFTPFATPVGEFVEAARQSPCRIYGCIEAARYVDPLNLRALAARWWGEGVDGIYLYNFFTMSPEWNRTTAAELTDPAALARLDKRYEIDSTGPFSPVEGHSGAFRHATPDAPLPVVLEPGYQGAGPVLQLEVADQIESARQTGALQGGMLALRLDILSPDDELVVRFNGVPLKWHQAQVDRHGWDRLQVDSSWWTHYPTELQTVRQEGVGVVFAGVGPLLRQGENRLEVHLRGTVPVTLQRVELAVYYI